MNTITIPKIEYKKILKTQEELRSQVEALREFVIEAVKEELNFSVIKRLEKRSQLLDQKRGRYFDSISSFRSYLRLL